MSASVDPHRSNVRVDQPADDRSLVLQQGAQVRRDGKIYECKRTEVRIPNPLNRGSDMDDFGWISLRQSEIGDS